MSDDIWATVLVALASIIGILITQIWSLRSSKASFVFQTRASFFQEAYRDNHTVLMLLQRIETGQNIEEDIEKVQKVIDDRPISFTLHFLFAWTESKDRLLKGDHKELNELADNLMDSLEFYLTKYYREVLGMRPKEVEAYRKAVIGQNQR